MKGKRIPATPGGLQQVSPKLRLDKDNFKTVKNQHEDTYYEEKIMQEMLQRRYITLHPTSGYKTATTEIKRVYDGFEVKYYLDIVKKKRTKKTEKEEDKTWLQKLLSISWHYAPTFFENLKQQNFNTLPDEGWEEAQVQLHEQALRTTKILALYTILPQRAMDAWTLLGTVPASYMENPTDNRHGYYNFHTEVQYAINDFNNLYVYNFPEDYNQNS
eukprot:26783-Amphidinium_carterae.1